MQKKNKSFKSIEKYEKNYLRNIIKELLEKTKGKPMIVKAFYVNNENNIWATFKLVRPYYKNIKTYTLCNHINIEKSIISKWYDIGNDFNKGNPFYLIVYPYIYNHYGLERGGLKIADDIDFQSIYKKNDFPKKNEKDCILEKCYLFTEEELENIKKLSMKSN